MFIIALNHFFLLSFVLISPGELTTACRILHHLVFPPNEDIDPMEPYVELKHRNALTQLFAADGFTALVNVMTNVAHFYEQPLLHRVAFTGRRRLVLIALLAPCVKLTRAILERLVKCMATEFKDLTAVVPLLGVYCLIEAMPSTNSTRMLSNEIIETLLVFTRAVDPDGSGNVAKSLWTQMLGEVLKMVSANPFNFLPGLKLLARLLPPILTPKETSSQDKIRALGFRKLWSAHLQAQANSLTETLRYGVFTITVLREFPRNDFQMTTFFSQATVCQLEYRTIDACIDRLQAAQRFGSTNRASRRSLSLRRHPYSQPLGEQPTHPSSSSRPHKTRSDESDSPHSD